MYIESTKFGELDRDSVEHEVGKNLWIGYWTKSYDNETRPKWKISSHVHATPSSYPRLAITAAIIKQCI